MKRVFKIERDLTRNVQNTYFLMWLLSFLWSDRESWKPLSFLNLIDMVEPKLIGIPGFVGIN